MDFKCITEVKPPSTAGSKYWHIRITVHTSEFSADAGINITCEELAQDTGILKVKYEETKKELIKYLNNQCKEEQNKVVAKIILGT